MPLRELARNFDWVNGLVVDTEDNKIVLRSDEEAPEEPEVVAEVAM